MNKCCKSVFHFEFMIPNALTNANKYLIFDAIVKPSFCPLQSTNMATADMQEKMTVGKRETTPSPGVFIEIDKV